jgi:hypothetical protein
MKSIWKFIFVTLWTTGLVVAAYIYGAKEQAANKQTIPEGTGITRPWALPLNNPETVPAASARYMRNDDIIYGVLVDGVYRAYPRWVMIAYHIANDTFGDIPVMLVQCEVCSSVSAFIPTVDKYTLNFIPCGLREGTFEICDTATLSRWSSFSGISHSGDLAGRSLTRIPVVVQTWKEWKTAHPRTDVILATENLKKRPHGRRYSDIGHMFIPPNFKMTAKLDDKRLGNNDLIFGINDLGRKKSVAVPLALIKIERKPYLYNFAGDKYLLIRFGDFSVTSFKLEDDASLKFRILPGYPPVLADDRGGKWNMFGMPEPGSKVKAKLEYADGYFAEWYEWVGSHPETEVAPRLQAL